MASVLLMVITNVFLEAMFIDLAYYVSCPGLNFSSSSVFTKSKRMYPFLST